MTILRLLLLGVFSLSCVQASALETFITRDGHRLLDGEREFRFAGIHAPELHRIEDDARGVCEADPRGWGQYFRWPTPDEQENWIKALTRSGHKAMRVYVLSVETPWDEACGRETHILAPAEKDGMPRLNEAAMVHYDRMIALSEKHGLRLILPFIDHWKWWGGREQLAAFYGESADDFYNTHSKTYAAYRHIIEQVINRKNTYTGRLYKDEKAIMAWETGNELRESTPEFVAKTAAHIRALDGNHLIMDGTYLKVIPESLENPDIDIISNHFYTVNENNNPGQILKDLKTIDGKKVYFIGEFGLRDAEGLEAIMQAAVHTEYRGARAAGAFIWGFRGHRHNGGFYWHKEYTGHYSYHIPGFPEADANEELPVVNLVRKAQAQMAELENVPPLPAPEAPILRGLGDPRERIDFMGAPLGREYRIQRAPSAEGPWQVIGDNISDGMQEYRPAEQILFRDTDRLVPGVVYHYRVIAKNESGESPPSNVRTFVVP